MATTSTLTASRTSDSTDRTPVLAARAGHPVRESKSPARAAARRILNALMRSLATPHV